MKRKSRWMLIVPSVVLLVGLSPASTLGFSDNNVNAAENYYNDKRFKISDRELVTMVGVPAEYDPESDELYAQCFVSVYRVKRDEIVRVGKAKGEFSAELWVLDVDSGALERHVMESGTFKTNANRLASWSYEIDLPDFANKELVPFIRTVIRFTNSKKANSVNTGCSVGFSKN